MQKQKFYPYAKPDTVEEKEVPYFSVVVEDKAQQLQEINRQRLLKERQMVDSLKTSSVHSRHQHSELARILEDDIKYWDQILASDQTSVKKKSSKAAEEGALGKRKSFIEDQGGQKGHKSEEDSQLITMEDLTFMLKSNQRYANPELIAKACAKQLLE